LSQKLAHIITDLDVSRLPEAPFAPGIMNPAYIDIIQRYEFRSLIPPEYLKPKKEVQKISVIPIDTLAKLETLQLSLQSPDGLDRSTILSTDAFGKIVIGYGDQICSIDSKIVDCSDFISYLLDSERSIVGYDLKLDIKRLRAIQKPAEVAGIEGQGRLF